MYTLQRTEQYSGTDEVKFIGIKYSPSVPYLYLHAALDAMHEQARVIQLADFGSNYYVYSDENNPAVSYIIRPVYNTEVIDSMRQARKVIKRALQQAKLPVGLANSNDALLVILTSEGGTQYKSVATCLKAIITRQRAFYELITGGN
jgi:hypothetical protein